MFTKNEVNKKLLDAYGLFEDGQPKYRVVWSTDEKENRVGKHEVWYGEIYVREEHGVKEYPKYSYCPDRWILEVRAYTFNPELTSKISYEPLFVMQDKNGNHLLLSLDACFVAINSILNRQKPQPWNWQREIYEEDKAFQKDKKEIINKLKERSRDNMDWKWADKEAVFVSTNQVNGSKPGDDNV